LDSAAAGQVTTATDIVCRSVVDEENEITAKIGRAKFALYHVGGIWDFLAGKVSNIAYPVWTKTVQDSLALLRAPRAGQLPGLLIQAHHTAKAKDQTSIFAIHSNIITIPKVVAGHMIVENIRTDPVIACMERHHLLTLLPTFYRETGQMY
jgi:hypothetical protein